MGLGKYTVPSGKAGVDSALCRGSGENGLQDDFAKAVRAFIEDLLGSDGISVSLGNYGYMAKDDARRLSKKGRPGYLQHIKRFGFGLAWEVSSAFGNDGGYVNLYDVLRGGDYPSKLDDAGIGIYKASASNGTASLIFFGAKSVSESTDADSIDYAGDNGTSSSAVGSGVSLASASYFFANQFNSIVDASDSNILQGERALANDVPLWDFVKKAVNSSLRACSSDPDGNFIAWYPDYYGKYGKTPHVIIKDIELRNLTITQSDASFYSHVFCPGVAIGGSKIDLWRTTGVVSIESNTAAIMSSGAAVAEGVDAVSDEVSPILDKILNIPDGERWKYTPRELYRRYGARPAKTQSLPNYQSGALIEDTDANGDDGKTPEHILPYLYALYNFMYNWAQQYKADIQVTFMPELFPGMRIKVESLDIEFYVKSVSHSMSYTGGFTTTVDAICPVGSLVSGMVASTPRG